MNELNKPNSSDNIPVSSEITDNENAISDTDNAFLFRYHYRTPYLCSLVLAEPCPEGAWGRGGLLGEHMFYSLESEPPLSRALAMLIYSTGLINEPMLEYLLGIPHARYLHKQIRYLEDKGALYVIESKYSAYQSKHFVFPNITKTPFSDFVKKRYSPADEVHLLNKPSDRIIAHAYGVTLSCLMFRIYCMVTAGISMRNILYEFSLRGNKATDKQGAAVTADAFIQMRLADSRKYGVFLEFDTGSEPITQLCRKFADYFNVDLYSSDERAIDRSCIVFSCHDAGVSPDRLCSKQHTVADYMRFLIHLVLSHFYVGTFEDVLNMDILPILADGNGYPVFYSNAIEHPRLQKHYRWFSTDDDEQINIKMVVPYICGNFELNDFLIMSGVSDTETYIQGVAGSFVSSERFNSDFVAELLEMIGFTDCFGNMSARTLPLRVVYEFIKSYDDDKGMLMRIKFNKGCYKSAFTRHLNIVSSFYGETTGLTRHSSRDLPGLIDGYDDRFISVPHYMALLGGYRLYTVSAYLLGNYIKHMMPYGNSDTYINCLSHILSNIYMKELGYRHLSDVYRLAAGSDYNFIKVRFRDIFVSDDRVVIPIGATYDSSSLLSASVMFNYYNGSSGNMDIVLIVNSLSEAIEINRKCLLRIKKTDCRGNCDDLRITFKKASGCNIRFLICPELFFSALSHEFL